MREITIAQLASRLAGVNLQRRGSEMRRNRIAIAVTAGVLLGFTGTGGAADAARCGGQPDGEVVLPEPNDSWDSPGEVISFLNKNGITRSSDLPPAGQLVKLLCGGAPG